jgi:DNA helicase-2/ATP-dependent DNA helicase PcrA
LYKTAKTYVLDLNYRSTPDILKVANNLIRNNQHRLPKNLTTNNPNGNMPVVFVGDTAQQEASFVARQILSMVKNKTYTFRDFVILYRAKHLSRTIEQEFINNGIPYYVYGDVRFYQRREIKDLVAYLKLVVKPNDELSLKRIINIPARGIGQLTIERISEYALKHNLNFYDVLLQIANHELEIERNKNAIQVFVILMEKIHSEVQQLLPVDVLKHIIKVIKYDEYLKGLDQYEERQDNVNALINAISEYQIKNPQNTLSDFLDEISLYTDTEEVKNISRNSVSLMTIHFAKGAEYKVVFIIGMNENIFPSVRLNRSTDMEEERRIAYVGITRSMEKLYLTCNLGFSPISSEKLVPSRFIKEIGKDSYRTETPQITTISKADLE